jgi:hypothetical protein
LRHCGHAVDPDEFDLYVHVVGQVSAEKFVSECFSATVFIRRLSG